MKHLWIKTATGTFSARRRLPATFTSPPEGFELWLGHPLFGGSRCVAQHHRLRTLHGIACRMTK